MNPEFCPHESMLFILCRLCSLTYCLNKTNTTHNFKSHTVSVYRYESPTVLFGFRAEDVATPLFQVRQHAEHCLNAELGQCGRRLLDTSPSLSVALCQYGQHLLRHLRDVDGVVTNLFFFFYL